MEYQTVKKEKKKINITASCLAIISREVNADERLQGLNICISIPFINKLKYDKWFESFCGNRWKGFYNVFISSDNGIRIPVIIHGGNAYNAGSCCLFGYFSPGYFNER